MKKVVRILATCLVVFLVSCGTSRRTKVASRKHLIKHQTNKSFSSRSVPKKKPSKIKETVDPVKSKPTNPSTNVSYPTKIRQYINEFAEVAKEEMRLYGIPASITLAQGILESGAGYGELTQRSRNHFGIKCHDWKGARVYHDDDRSQECFRKYSIASESFRDHSLFLVNRSRYASLFKLKKDDYHGWAKGLRAAGYATDKKYPAKLINIIDKYKLYEFDNDHKNKTYKHPTSRVSMKQTAVTSISYNSIKEYTVQKGDTLYSIAKRYKVSVNDLRINNKLKDNTIKIGQILKINN